MKIFRYGRRYNFLWNKMLGKGGLSLFLLWLLVIPAYAGLNIQRTAGDLDDGLVGHWTFDGADISGAIAYDRSGQGNNGTINGNVTNNVGKLGQGLKFAGSNSYIEAPQIFSGSIDDTNLTYVAWVKINAFNNYGAVVNQGKANYEIATMSPNGIMIWNQDDTIMTYSGASSGAWYHLAVVKNGTSSRFIIRDLSGTIVYDNTVVYSKGHNWGYRSGYTGLSDYDVYIGTNACGEFFNGTIDDVRVYNRALSADEVKRLYNIGKGVSTAASQQNKQTSGLVGYWTFDGPDISGSTAYDRSGQGNNGTINGATRTVGKIGQAMKFGGGGQNISAGTTGVDTTAGHHNTVVFWMNYTGPLGDAVFAFDNGGDYDLWFTDNPCFGFNTHNSEVLGISASGLNNRWVHVAAVFYNGTPSAANNKLYIDGSQQSIYYCRGSSSISRTAGGTLYWASSGGYEFAGKIDEGRVYNRELSADEIKALYNQAGSKFHASQENQLTTGLVGYWPFNGPDISGNAALDRSGQGNHGTMVNSPLKIIGKVGQGLQFLGPGVDTYISVPHKSSINLTSSMTLAFWVKPASNITYDWTRLMEKSYPTGYYIGSGTGTNDISYWLNGNEVFDTADNVLSVGTWKHVAVTFDDTSNEVVLYIDGNSHTVTSYTGTITGNTNALQFTESGNRCFNGVMDEIRIYTRALSAEEIKRLYNMGR
jgi:hypothetical protein